MASTSRLESPCECSPLPDAESCPAFSFINEVVRNVSYEYVEVGCGAEIKSQVAKILTPKNKKSFRNGKNRQNCCAGNA
jgi:hypothetical protein